MSGDVIVTVRFVFFDHFQGLFRHKNYVVHDSKLLPSRTVSHYRLEQRNITTNVRSTSTLLIDQIIKISIMQSPPYYPGSRGYGPSGSSRHHGSTATSSEQARGNASYNNDHPGPSAYGSNHVPHGNTSRRPTPRESRSLHLDTQAGQRVQEASNHDHYHRRARQSPDLNKPLPPDPRPWMRDPEVPRCTPIKTESPIDRAAHWVNKKVITPVKQFVRDLKSPAMVEEIISTPNSANPTSRKAVFDDFRRGRSGSEADLHRIRLMEGQSPARAHASDVFFFELNPAIPPPVPQKDEKSRESTHQPRHSTHQPREKPQVDREAEKNALDWLASQDKKPKTSKHTRGLGSNGGSQILSAVETGLNAAQQAGHRLGLNHEAGRMVFADRAPPGMMDPCSVCGLEDGRPLRFGRCQICK